MRTNSRAVADCLNECFAAWAPKVRQSGAAWARENARLKDGSSYVPFPFQEEWADAMTDPAIPQVTVMKSARVGYTQVVKNLLGYAIDQQPVAIITYFPTVRDAEKFSRIELAQVLGWQSTMRNIVYAPRDKRNTLRSKLYPGGSMLLNGTNSPGEFRADTADWVICEEVDGYPVTAGVEGDPVFLAFKRTTTSEEPKRIAGSTPKIKDASRIASLFEEGTQEYRYVPCPHCGTMQRLVFGDGTGAGIRWEPRDRPTRAWYQCVNGCEIEEHHKADMDAAGKWRAHAPQNWPHRSFHIWAAYSQFEGAAWLTIAREFLASRRDKNLLVGFVNTVLGETFEERGEAPQWRRLYDRRELWWTPGKVPPGALILLAGLDVQKDRIEIYVWGWGVDRQSWLIEHKVIPHSPYDARAWVLASEFVQGSWEHASGAVMRLARIGADTGFATTQVEAWCRLHPGLAIPIKGSSTMGAPVFAWSTVRDSGVKGGKRKRGLRLGMIGGTTIIFELYGFLSQDMPTAEEQAEGELPPVGYVHLGEDATEEICKQLVADQWLEKTKEWKQPRPNEALDCWKYARAMAAVLGLDRWSAAKWEAIAETVAGDVTLPEDNPPAATAQTPAVQPQMAPPAPQPSPQPVRQAPRVGRSSFMGRRPL